MFWLGVNSEYGLHHAKLKPDEEVIEKAITFLSQYVKWKGIENKTSALLKVPKTFVMRCK